MQFAIFRLLVPLLSVIVFLQSSMAFDSQDVGLLNEESDFFSSEDLLATTQLVIPASIELEVDNEIERVDPKSNDDLCVETAVASPAASSNLGFDCRFVSFEKSSGGVLWYKNHGHSKSASKTHDSRTGNPIICGESIEKRCNRYWAVCLDRDHSSSGGEPGLVGHGKACVKKTGTGFFGNSETCKCEKFSH